MKSSRENAKVIEEQKVAIVDYSIEQTTLIGPSPNAKPSRGWFNSHEGSKYQVETERKREHLRCFARKI